MFCVVDNSFPVAFGKVMSTVCAKGGDFRFTKKFDDVDASLIEMRVCGLSPLLPVTTGTFNSLLCVRKEASSDVNAKVPGCDGNVTLIDEVSRRGTNR